MEFYYHMHRIIKSAQKAVYIARIKFLHSLKYIRILCNSYVEETFEIIKGESFYH